MEHNKKNYLQIQYNATDMHRVKELGSFLKKAHWNDKMKGATNDGGKPIKERLLGGGEPRMKVIS